MTSARFAFEVRAGVIPGNSMEEYTKQFVVTSEAYEADPAGTLRDAGERAYEYAKSLTDPRMLNWVRIDWVYF